MNYHNITHEDMLNGDGLRVVLWVAGCNHNCKGCHNPETHDVNGGIPFDDAAKQDIFEYLNKDYTAGITFSGGDPLHPNNRETITKLAKEIKGTTHKNIWLYTGYIYEQIKDLEIMNYIDVLVEGPFILELKDDNLEWRGSCNQRIIELTKRK